MNVLPERKDISDRCAPLPSFARPSSRASGLDRRNSLVGRHLATPSLGTGPLPTEKKGEWRRHLDPPAASRRGACAVGSEPRDDEPSHASGEPWVPPSNSPTGRSLPNAFWASHLVQITPDDQRKVRLTRTTDIPSTFGRAKTR